ncbi:MAG: carboxypeptidase regulatory-like domain-containing protein [Saprospiraceae bacterium]|nr:carboxypeptidase regulatory-like domain-containing protein [Saprospiraceae bacterium]
MRFITYLSITASLFFFTSCHKDDFNESEEQLTTFTAQVVEEIQGNVIGYVYNDQHMPVEGATVQIYSATSITNAFGVFTFKNVKLDKNGTYLTARKEGYFLGSDMVYPRNAECYSDIKMLSLETGKTFEAPLGGDINITGGGLLSFPANAIVDLNGVTFGGSVQVSARLLNPQDDLLAATMPGALVGDAADGKTVVLVTAGMIAVDLRTAQGEKLQLGNGKKATFSIPALSKEKPSQIALWSFDESKGRWKEEGIAKLTNGNYTAEVGHFSFWNCDAPFPLIEVCGRVVYSDNTPVKNAWIRVEANGLNTAGGQTDAEGVFCGKMPKGVKLTFYVHTGGYCSDPVLVTELGPFNNNTQLNDFVITVNSNELIVKGTVQCNGVAIPKAIVVFEIQNIRRVFRANESGEFNENLSFLLCENFTDYKLFAFNEIDNQASPTLIRNVGDNQPVILNVCDIGCNFGASINFNCDNQLKATPINGSGNFSYKWSNGSIDQTLVFNSLDSTQGIYCVTITDITANCEKTFCKEFRGKINLSLYGGCSTVIESYIYGGVPPYTYSWDNGNTGPAATISGPGSYCLTVTDANGCTASACTTVSGTPLFVNPVPTTCNKDLYSLDASPFTQGYISGQGTQLTITSTANLSVFATGFVYRLIIFDGNCEAAFDIELPRLTALDVTATNTSCGSCNDGFLTYTLGSDCQQCTPGAVKIFKTSDLNTDLSAQNAAKTLSKGLYYVVVEDLNTSCYIAFRKVEIL